MQSSSELERRSDPCACAFIEVGGSSVQIALIDNDGRMLFGELRELPADLPVAVCAPGVVSEGRVYFASNLPWPDVWAPGPALGIANEVVLVVNDALSAGLGEVVLRGGPGRVPTLLYIGLGTGLGASLIDEGVSRDLALGHLTGFGREQCPGCGGVGCLDTEISGRVLPWPLTADDQNHVAATLACAIRREVPTAELVVLGGGVTRSNHELVPLLRNHLPATLGVEMSLAPLPAKSAAAWGLRRLIVGQIDSNSI